MNNLWLMDNLTKKQREYVSLLASGLTTIQIAQGEHKSHHTIRNTISKAKERIGAISTANLIATAVLEGWIVKEDNEKPYTFKSND
jgi:DNA-binding CsgD family transcriptional regulator